MYPIHHTFGPHVTWPMWRRSIALLFQPWRWSHGKDTEMFRMALEKAFHTDAFLFSSGRESLLAILKTIGLRSGEEIILQAYTCIAVPNAIHAAGGVPVYADVDGDTLNIDITEVEKHITPRTRAVMAQHTFGIPADVRRLREICDKHKLLLIEDCAHIVPDEPSPVARIGDFAFFSFGRDKALFGVTGGAVLCRKHELTASFQALETSASPLPRSVIGRLLLYSNIYAKARVLFFFRLGKIYLALCRTLKLLIPIVTAEEKRGHMPAEIHRMPNACAALALQSFHQLREINTHRRMLTRYYIDRANMYGWNVIPGITSDTPLQKFPLFFPHADALRAQLKTKNIYLDDGWTGCVICPRTVDAASANYSAGSDPCAEEIGESILSLPTHPTMTFQQARRLARELERALKELKVES